MMPKQRKLVESNNGRCPKRPSDPRLPDGHLFQSETNTPPYWCIYCGRGAIMPPDPRYRPRGSSPGHIVIPPAGEGGRGP